MIKRLSATAKDLGPGHEAFKNRLDFLDGTYSDKVTLHTADKAVEYINKEGIEGVLEAQEEAENRRRRMKYKAGRGDRLDLVEIFNEAYKKQCDGMPRQPFVAAGAGTARLDFQNPKPYYKLTTDQWKPPVGSRSMRSWTTSGLKHVGKRQGVGGMSLSDDDSDFDDHIESIAERANRGEMIAGLDDVPRNRFGYDPDADLATNLQKFLYRYVGYEIDNEEYDETGAVTESGIFRTEHDHASDRKVRQLGIRGGRSMVGTSLSTIRLRRVQRRQKLERFMKFRPIVGKIAYDTKARLSVFETRERGLDLTEALEKMESEIDRIQARNKLWHALRRRNVTLLQQTIDLGKNKAHVGV